MRDSNKTMVIFVAQLATVWLSDIAVLSPPS